MNASTNSEEKNEMSEKRRENDESKADEKKKVDNSNIGVSDCPCCTEKYTKQARKRVSCMYCNASACLGCQKGYLTSNIHDPHCMFCKVAWNEDFLRDHFTNNWLVKEYSVIEKENLWERQKSLMPDTMLVLEREKLEDDCDDEKSNVRHQIRSLQEQLTIFLDHTVHRYNALEFIDAVSVMNERLKSMQFTFSESFDINRCKELLPSAKKQEKKRAQFIKPCPAPECRGFLSTQWKCTLCDTKVCPDCHAIKRLYKGDAKSGDANKSSDEHQCKEEDLATAALISKDCKNCPKCGTSIFKIQGCDQMFCTNCTTPFCWSTLEIINSSVHNPHYFEWLNRGGTRRDFQPQCNDDFRDTAQLRAALYRHISPSTLGHICAFHQSFLHIVDAHRARFMYNNAQTDTLTIRKYYLTNKVTEDLAKQSIYRIMKKQKIQKACTDLIEMLQTATNAILANIPRGNVSWSNDKNSEKEKQIKEILQQIKELMRYYNLCIYNIHHKYKSEAQFSVFTSTYNYTVMKRSSNLPEISL